jgi:predicted GTPase
MQGQSWSMLKYNSLVSIASSSHPLAHWQFAGKGGVGKSSTVNSMLGEAAARVQAFKLQAETDVVTPFVRQASTSPCWGGVSWSKENSW